MNDDSVFSHYWDLQKSFVSDNKLYIFGSYKNLDVYDVSDPSTIDRIDELNNVNSFTKSNDFLHV